MATPNLANPTSLTPTVLVATKLADNTDIARYTVGAGKAVRITQGSLANVSGVACTVGLSIVPAAQAANVGDGTHKVIPDSYPLAAGDTLSLKDYIGEVMLGEGDIIAIHPGIANAIDVVITGVVIA